MRVTLSVPERAQQLWKAILAAADADQTSVSAWLLRAAALRLDFGDFRDAELPEAVIRRVVREELAARDAGTRTLSAIDAARLALLDKDVRPVAFFGASEPPPDGPQSHAQTTEPQPVETPASKPERPAACKHARAVKGWCGECRTGGHL
jgi:hypothetical protein